MMKKTTKTIAAFWLLISTAYSLFLLAERKQQLAYFLTEYPKLSNVLQPKQEKRENHDETGKEELP